MREPEQQIDVDRLAHIAHYVIARTEPERLGAVKLNKVLWYADLENHRRHGRSMTGLIAYMRMPLGPVPYGIGNALRRLKSTNRIYERIARVYSFNQRQFYLSYRAGYFRVFCRRD